MKHVDEDSPQATSDDYKGDVQGRRYRNIVHNFESLEDEYLADNSIAIPRYLIQIDR